jgi:hypothetical protein
MESVVKPSGDPVRLGADSGTLPWLKSALSDAKADLPAIDVDGLTARVNAAIATNLPLPDVAPIAKSIVGKALASKAIFAGAGLAIGITAGTVWTLRKSAHPVVPQPTAVMQSASAVELPLSSSAAEVPSVAPSAPVQAPAPQVRAVATPLRDSHVSTPANEATLLDQARLLLPTEPRRALALTQEHAKRFPRSVLAQEREVIAIQALSRLGKTDAAKKRGVDFERQYPGSAHQNKVDQTMRGR